MQPIPYLFDEQSSFPRIEVEGQFLFIEYRAYQASSRVQTWSEQHFIVLVLQGHKEVTAGSGHFPLKADEALFLRKGAYLMSEIPEGRGLYQSTLFFMSEAFLKRFAHRHADLLPKPNQASAAPAIHLPEPAPVAQFYHAVLPYFNTPLPEARRRALCLKFEELLLNLIAEPANATFALFLNGLLQDKPAIASVMEQNYRLNVPLHVFAQLSQRSLSAFKRDFAAAFSMPPGQWLRVRRLQHAAHLLQSTPFPVSQICSEAGFESLSHFSRAFHLHFGATPTAYRAAVQTE